jgi:hypothetical protein
MYSFISIRDLSVPHTSTHHSRPYRAFRMMDENDDLMLESDWDLDLHHHPY